MLLRLNDIRLKGCGYTLFPAAEQFGVSKDVMYELLCSIYKQLGTAVIAVDEDAIKKQDAIKKENPEIPQTLKCLSDESAEKALRDELVEETDGGYRLTDISMQVLEKAAAIQNKLDDEGFHCCPCMHSCC